MCFTFDRHIPLYFQWQRQQHSGPGGGVGGRWKDVVKCDGLWGGRAGATHFTFSGICWDPISWIVDNTDGTSLLSNCSGCWLVVAGLAIIYWGGYNKLFLTWTHRLKLSRIIRDSQGIDSIVTRSRKAFPKPVVCHGRASCTLQESRWLIRTLHPKGLGGWVILILSVTV
jgi:hypothetical protein